MNTIRYFGKDEPPATTSVASVGGKAHSLIKMAALELPVPPGFVLDVEFFNDWFDQIKKTAAWSEFLAADTPSKLRESCDALKNEAMKMHFSAGDQSVVLT